MTRWALPFVCVLLMPRGMPAGIVDRVAIAVGNRVITTSEIRERIALAAFQNAVPIPKDAAAWKSAAEQLVDQKLVDREMLLGRYSTLEEGDSGALLSSYMKEHSLNTAQLHNKLREYGLTEQQLERDLARQSDLLAFLNLRFRPAVQVTEEDVRNYYRDRIAPTNTPAHSVTLEDMRTAIEEILTNQRADVELDAWLKDQRKRIAIDYRPEAFPNSTPPANAQKGSPLQ